MPIIKETRRIGNKDVEIKLVYDYDLNEYFVTASNTLRVDALSNTMAKMVHDMYRRVNNLDNKPTIDESKL